MTTSAAQSSASAQRSNGSLKIEKFRPRIGAIVSGVQLDQPIDEDAKTRLRAGLLEHGVLFFRDQQFGPQRFLEIAKIFGVPYKQNEYNHGLEGFDEIEVLENSDRRQQRADQWHADVTWQANPPKATILQAQDLPAQGGDTVWSTSAGAYDLLDPKLAAYLETLTAVNSLEVTRLPEYHYGVNDYGTEFRKLHRITIRQAAAS
jgi:taurine dioxygenase